MRNQSTNYSPDRKIAASIDGFTLIEIVATLVIISIVSIIIINRMGSTDIYKIVSEIEILRNHLRYAQGKSMTSLKTESWGISVSGGSYTLQKAGATAPINLPNENSATHILQSGVSVTTGNGTTITFDDFGSPGNIDVTITLNGSRSLTITRETGFLQ